jgi:two-component system chemotaxis response regulator CheB
MKSAVKKSTSTDSGNDKQEKENRIIVMGASTGGFEAYKKIIQELPADFNHSIFIVWHMSPEVRGVLPHVLNGINSIYAAHAYDNEEIKPNRIYIARPDYHMIIEEGKIRVTHGPKENRFRPAIDPLFRSAAYEFGNRVIGVILTGGLDDGSAGLWSVKHFGGLTIVQDPLNAEVSSMPANAIEKVEVDYVVALSEIPELILRLSNQETPKIKEVMKDDQTKKEIEIAAEKRAMEKGNLIFPELTPYTCPECHGVLSRLHNGKIIRYRCHTGHAYSADALIVALTEKIEDGLYNAIRGMDETVMLLNHLGDHYAEINQPKLAATYFRKAKEADDRSELVRKAAYSHELLSVEKLRDETETSP